MLRAEDELKNHSSTATVYFSFRFLNIFSGDVSCDSLNGIQTILVAIIAMACISSILAFIASYISCCALCNQEHVSIYIIARMFIHTQHLLQYY